MNVLPKQNIFVGNCDTPLLWCFLESITLYYVLQYIYFKCPIIKHLTITLMKPSLSIFIKSNNFFVKSSLYKSLCTQWEAARVSQ